MTYLPITGTFLDEITVDIPSQNWGPQEWATEFGTLAASGIDTVILIRAGCGERLACPSAAISQRVPTLPVYADLVRLFLDLAAEHGITFYLGLYDSNVFWYRYDWQTELELNLAFIDEVCDRYAGSPAFGGWYLPHETTDSSLRILDLNTALARRVKSVTPGLPVLVSPFFFGRSDLWNGTDLRSRPREPDEHARIWDEIFGHYAGLVDYCAFQDGTADPLRVGRVLRRQHGGRRQARYPVLGECRDLRPGHAHQIPARRLAQAGAPARRCPAARRKDHLVRTPALHESQLNLAVGPASLRPVPRARCGKAA